MTLQPRGFPPLKPATRSQTFGVFPESRFDDLTGFDIRFKRGEIAVKHRLTLTFTELTSAEAQSVFAHYRSVRGAFVPFALDTTTTLCGDNDPLFDQWRYLARPVLTDRSGDYYDLTCELVAFTQDLPARALGAPDFGETVSIVDAGAGEDFGEPNGVYFRVDQNTVEIQNDAVLTRQYTIAADPVIVETIAPGKLERSYYIYELPASTLLHQKRWINTASSDETRRLPTAATNITIVDDPATFDQTFAASPHGSDKALAMTESLTTQSDYVFDIPLGVGGIGDYFLAQFWISLDANSLSTFVAPGCVRKKSDGSPICEFTFDSSTGEAEVQAFDGAGTRIRQNVFNFNLTRRVPGNDPGLSTARQYILATYIKDAEGVALSIQIHPALQEWEIGGPRYSFGYVYSWQNWDTETPNFDLSADQLELVLGSTANGDVRFDGFLLGYRVDTSPPPGYNRQATFPPEWAPTLDGDIFRGAIPLSLGFVLDNPTFTGHPDFPTDFRPGIQEANNTILDYPLPANTVQVTTGADLEFAPLIYPPEAWPNQPLYEAIGSDVVLSGTNNLNYVVKTFVSGGLLTWNDLDEFGAATENATLSGTNNSSYVVTLLVNGESIDFGDVAGFGAATESATVSGVNNNSYTPSTLTQGPVATFAGNDAFEATGPATLAP